MVVGWLVCQAVAVSSAPFALWHAGPAFAVEDDCCPGVAPGQVCPMHHTKEGQRKCVVRGACASSSAALIALSGGLGLPARADAAAVVAAANGDVVQGAPDLLTRLARPESPPPRA
jgi:hypothetical protein